MKGQGKKEVFDFQNFRIDCQLDRQTALSWFRFRDRYWRPRLSHCAFVWDFLIGCICVTIGASKWTILLFVLLCSLTGSWILHAKQWCYIFKRRQWIDPPKQQRTFPSNLRSIYPSAPPSIHHVKVKTQTLFQITIQTLDRDWCRLSVENV